MLLPLTPAQMPAYRRTLASVYTKRIRVALLDRTGDTIENLTRAFRSGDVTVDAHRDVTRATTISILDPRHKYGFDSDTYLGGELDLTRMLRIFWVIDGPLLDDPVSVPVFTGPITRLQRDGALVSIEAQGKEVRGLSKSHRTLTVKKGALRTDAIKAILAERLGETRLGGIPDLPHRLPDHLVVGPQDQPWRHAMHLAASMNRQLYYDGAGVPYLRPRPARVTWRFRGGQNGAEITSPVSVSADLTNVKNHVVVTGATPKGKKQPLMREATADRQDPLSPWKLGTDAAPMWLDDEVSNTHLRSAAECQKVANHRLREGLRLIHDTSFNAVPVPHLDPLDLVHVSTDYEAATTRLDTFTLPLGLGGDMTVGYIDPYSLSHHRGGHRNRRR